MNFALQNTNVSRNFLIWRITDIVKKLPYLLGGEKGVGFLF